MSTRLTAEQKQMAHRLKAGGLSLREIARQMWCSHEAVRFVLDGNGGPGQSAEWKPADGRLTLAEREEISLGLARRETFTAIAVRLKRSVSTVSREVGANGGRDGYRAWAAHQRARERMDHQTRAGGN